MPVGLLPLLVLSLIGGTLARTRASLLNAVAPAACLWALLGAASLEALGLFDAITRPALIVFWLATGAATIVAMLRQPRTAVATAVGPAEPGPDRRFAALAAVAIAILAATLAVALLSPPNNWDSMAYHLPRIEEWIQQRSLAFFPTPFDAQLAQNPLTEMLILHLRLLAGGDRLDNLVQWLAFAGCVALAPVVARRLGAARRGQSLAALLVATIPMAILQGSGTQTDLVVSFFLLAAAERLLAWTASRRVVDGLGVGAATGLAILAKGTAYFWAAPIGLCVLLVIIRNRTPRDVIVGAAMLALAVGINAGHYRRDLALFGTPLGPHGREVSTDHSAAAIASGLLRNLASNLVTPSKRVNDALVRGVDQLHRLLGIGASDPGTTFPGRVFAELPRNMLSGDYATYPLQLALLALAAVLLGRGLVRPGLAPPMPGRLWAYGGAVVAGGVLFCAMLRWQPWITRLQLPFFVLLMPAIAAVLAARLGRRWLIAGGVVLSLAALPCVLCNQERPLYGDPVRWWFPGKPVAPNIVTADPWQLIFWNNPRRYIAYRDAVARIADRAAAGVGLMTGPDSMEYPLWRMLKGSMPWVRVGHICLGDARSPAPPPRFKPAVMLAVNHAQPPLVTCANGVFAKAAGFPTGEPEPDAEIGVYYRVP